LLLLLACAAACIAVSSQSFWIDETQTVLKAIQPTVHGWWSALYSEHNSNLQLPLYMIYVWGWARVFGVSELSMRAANIPWFFAGFFAIAHFLRRRGGLRNAALLVYCLHPFVWYYLNEARPYLMQLSGALLVSGALFAALDEPEEPLPASWWWLYGAGLTILCGAGLLGVPWAGTMTVLLLFRAGFLRSAGRAGLPAMLVFGPILAFLAVYFAWTLKEGAQPGHAGMSVLSIPFVFYEHLGFVGLGPGRVDVRSGGFGTFLHSLPLLCLLGVPLIYALVCAAAERFGLSLGRLVSICIAVLIPLGAVFALGFAEQFRVLGRHVTPLFPFMLCAVAFAVAFLWSRGRVLDRVAVVLIVIGLATSALECRFAFRHQKDDNRDACAIANATLAQGGTVWWTADDATARFYGLPVSNTPTPGMALFLWKPEPAQVARLAPPTLVVLSKPDLFDTNSGVRDFLKQHGYTQFQELPAFTFWRK
jgi:hypothetical protein